MFLGNSSDLQEIFGYLQQGSMLNKISGYLYQMLKEIVEILGKSWGALENNGGLCRHIHNSILSLRDLW